MKKAVLNVTMGATVAVALVLGVAQTAWAQGAGGGVWSDGAHIPVPRNETFAAAVGGKLYSFGGFDGETYESTHVEAYDPVTNTWEERGPMLEGGNHIGITVLGDTIYIGGGFHARQHSDEKDTFLAYHPATDEWEWLPPMPGPKGAVSLAGVGNTIHVIGGRRMNNVLDEHDVYNVDTRQWSRAAPLPTARDHAGVAAFGGKIHIFGGRLGETVANVALHDIYDPATDSWASAPPIPTARSAGAFAVYKDMIFYLGGECRLDDTNFDEVEAFDPATNSWRDYGTLPVPLHGFGAGTIGNSLYAAGGSNPCGNGVFNERTLVFTLP
jgi:N-acetylneuraminic acid mutarotase